MVAEYRGGKRRTQAKLTQGQLERLANGPEAARHWTAHDRDEVKRRLAREKKHLKRDVPSEPWFEAKWHRGEQFPPGLDETRMQCCKRCGRYTPPNCLGQNLRCLDCEYGSMTPAQLDALPSSPGTVVCMMKMRNAAKRA